MAGLSVRSVLVTGANRGIGLGLVQHFLRMPKPPQWIFAGCRDPKGQRAQVRLGWEAVAVLGNGRTQCQGETGTGWALLSVWRSSQAPGAQGSWAETTWEQLCRGCVVGTVLSVIESSPSSGFRAAGAQCRAHGRAGMEPEQCWLFLGKAESLHSPCSLSLPTQCPLFQELQNLASKHPNIIIIPLGRCPHVGILCPSPSGKCPGWAHPGSPCWEGAVPRGWCLQGHRALPPLGAQRGLHPGDAGSDLPCVGSAEVADPASIKAAAAKVGEHLGGSGLNLLINNAGMVKSNILDTETLEDMSEVYTTNTIGPLLMAQVRPSPKWGCPGGA